MVEAKGSLFQGRKKARDMGADSVHEALLYKCTTSTTSRLIANFKTDFQEAGKKALYKVAGSALRMVVESERDQT